jgi:L-ascorbate 6-phosphate lactonase
MPDNDYERERSVLAADIRGAVPPKDGFSVWFLGQNSFVIKGVGGFLIAIDPYLSDWCATRGKISEPTPKSRLYPPPLLPSELHVDLVLLTHSHCDHADPETLSALAVNKRTRVVGPRDAVAVATAAGFPIERVRTIHAGEELNFERPPGVLAAAERFRSGAGRGTLTVRGTFALPTDGTDLNHIGFLLRFPNDTTFWDTGDSAWCDSLPLLAGSAVRAALPQKATGPDVMAVCINAGYGNLSHWDAARLAGAVKPRFAVPTHWDLFPHNRCPPEPFKTSLEKNAPDVTYLRMERGRRYDLSDGAFCEA